MAYSITLSDRRTYELVRRILSRMGVAQVASDAPTAEARTAFTFSAISLKTKGFKFDRDEANER